MSRPAAPPSLSGAPRGVLTTGSLSRYLYWVQKDAGVQARLAEVGVGIPEFVHDNLSGYSVRCSIDGSVINRISARPKSVASCRGDAPACVIVDEVAFVEAPWFWKFLYPLLQIGARVFTLATTPGPLGEFFDDFVKDVERENKKLNFFFFFINHSLACAPCYEAGCASQCCHKLYAARRPRGLVGVVAPRPHTTRPRDRAGTWCRRGSRSSGSSTSASSCPTRKRPTLRRRCLA